MLRYYGEVSANIIYTIIHDNITTMQYYILLITPDCVPFPLYFLDAAIYALM